jgi:hypothetical protein
MVRYFRDFRRRSWAMRFLATFFSFLQKPFLSEKVLEGRSDVFLLHALRILLSSDFRRCRVGCCPTIFVKNFLGDRR